MDTFSCVSCIRTPDLANYGPFNTILNRSDKRSWDTEGEDEITKLIRRLATSSNSNPPEWKMMLVRLQYELSFLEHV